ncbi:MAG: amidase domain-containing protein [Oscillospiraceae bacterium]
MIISTLVLVTLTTTSTASYASAISTSRVSSYASKYVTKHNSKYIYIRGNNCTNFVSQCLGDSSEGGGLSQAKNLNRAQAILLATKKTIDDADSWFYDTANGYRSESWASATKLSKYMKSQRNCIVKDYGSLKNNVSSIYSNLSTGDVLQFGYSESNICHSVVVTGKDIESANLYKRYAYSVSVRIAQNTGDTTWKITKKVDKNGNSTFEYPDFNKYSFVRIIKTSYK